jgi:hypothetical protein
MTNIKRHETKLDTIEMLRASLSKEDFEFLEQHVLEVPENFAMAEEAVALLNKTAKRHPDIAKTLLLIWSKGVVFGGAVSSRVVSSRVGKELMAENAKLKEENARLLNQMDSIVSVFETHASMLKQCGIICEGHANTLKRICDTGDQQ